MTVASSIRHNGTAIEACCNSAVCCPPESRDTNSWGQDVKRRRLASDSTLQSDETRELSSFDHSVLCIIIALYALKNDVCATVIVVLLISKIIECQ